jgi:opacity protein-like surface antigen
MLEIRLPLRPGRRRGRALALVLVAGAGVTALSSERAAAQDWTLKSSLSEKVLYDDNLLLSPDHPISTFGSITTPSLTLTRDAPTSNMEVRAQFPVQLYLDHSELNSADQLVDFSGSKDLSERSTLGLSANFDRRTSLRNSTDDTERFTVDKYRRTDWGLTPSWTYRLSPIDTMRLGVDYQDVTFDTSKRTNYRSYGPSFGLSHAISPVAAIFGDLGYSRFEPDVPTNRRTNVFAGSIGYRYEPTERFKISGSGGLSYDVTTEDGRPDDKGLGFLFKFDFDYQMTEQLRGRIGLVHDSEPSGEGRQTTRNRATLGLDYELTPLTDLSFDARYTDNEDYLGTGVTSNSGSTHFVSLQPSLNYRLTDDLTLGAQYEFRHKTSGRGTATSNAAFVTLRYAFPTLGFGGF